MRPSADSDQKVPPHSVGGSSASRASTNGDISMAERVAREHQRLIDQNGHIENLAEKSTLDEVLAAVQDADNGRISRRARTVADAAPVRRKGAPPPPRTPPQKPQEEPNKTRSRKPRKTGQIEDISDEQLLAEAGIEPFYSTIEAAQFFDRTTQWIYWGLGRDEGGPVFIYPDGTPIVPQRIGDPITGRRRFTLPVIKDILLSSYRRGNIEPDELKKILRRIRINQLGGEWREREGWHKIKGKWVHPKLCTQIDGKWAKKKGSPDESCSEKRS